PKRLVSTFDAARPRRRGDRMNPRRSYCVSVVSSAVVAFLCANAAAQEGYYGVGHEKDGAWMPVPSNKINNVIAPDGGAHVCAPKQEDVNRGCCSASCFLRTAEIPMKAISREVVG